MSKLFTREEKKRVFHVYVLRTFSNFKSLKLVVVLSPKMPTPSEIRMEENEEYLETKEINAEVQIL
jgi:hypothetical protein